MRYTLEDINNIIFAGFHFELDTETIETISKIALQVGSPDYVKTPVFAKREKTVKEKEGFQKRKNKNIEITNDDEWNNMRSFQATKLEKKEGVDGHIDKIRYYLNMMTDKNYDDMRNKIVSLINDIADDEENMNKVGSNIFEIASTNRFYSKIYANLYADLMHQHSIMKTLFDNSFSQYMNLFTNVECIEPTENYDKFCEINKINERRKALSAFFINLMKSNVVTKQSIVNLVANLLSQVMIFISQENKKTVVDELTENISILYAKEVFDNDALYDYELIQDMRIYEVIEFLSNSKVKDYKSLTNKTIFKFMDMIEM